MRLRTWPVAAVGLLGLLVLIVASLATAYERAQATAGQLDELNRQHRAIFSKLRVVRTDVYQSAIYARDYLLDTRGAQDDQYRERLVWFRDSTRAALDELALLLAGTEARAARLADLRVAVDMYFAQFDLFTWSPADKLRLGAQFVRTEVISRREEALGLAREIEALNDAAFDEQRATIVERRTAFQQSLLTLLWQCLVLGAIVSVVAVARLRALERRHDEQREFAEAAERRMRLLSQQIVAAQEEERRKLSRELHDHVGQLLTGLRMSLGGIDRATGPARPTVLADARRVVDDLTRIVRDLASGLRPSMLDDFGLQPALEWLARDVSRRCDLPVTVTVEGAVEDLPDAHRTCVYRVVQEALTNVVKHARATRVEVTVRRTVGGLTATVVDDGRGFVPDGRAAGIGLRGVEERVKELSGSVQVVSTEGQGTSLAVSLPLSMEVSSARLAG